MQVVKAINNNVVSCVDSAGREVIAMGRGLGYRARAGTALDETQAEKIFRMESQSETDRLKKLLVSLPPEQIDLCSRIIACATETLNKRLSETVYLTLTDHLSFAIARQRAGQAFRNALLTEVRIFYPREFAVGRRALEMIAAELNVHFPDDEAASIAMHLVNAEYDTSISEMMHITQALHDILSMLDHEQGMNIQKNSLHYDEFIVYLKFLALRAFSDKEEIRSEEEFVRVIRKTYPEECACAQRIAAYLETQAKHPLSEEETAYLALQIRRVSGTAEKQAIQERKQENGISE